MNRFWECSADKGYRDKGRRKIRTNAQFSTAVLMPAHQGEKRGEKQKGGMLSKYNVKSLMREKGWTMMNIKSNLIRAVSVKQDKAKPRRPKLLLK